MWSCVLFLQLAQQSSKCLKWQVGHLEWVECQSQEDKELLWLENGGNQRWSGGTAISDWQRDRHLIGCRSCSFGLGTTRTTERFLLCLCKHSKKCNLKKVYLFAEVWFGRCILAGAGVWERTPFLIFFFYPFDTVNMERRWNGHSIESWCARTAQKRLQ